MIEHQQELITFPVTLQANWCLASSVEIDVHLRDWLLDPGSLTQRLKMHCTEFSVYVIGQKVEPCSPLEANNDIVAGEDVLVREVLLFCDNLPQVFARSLLPLRSLTGEERKLASLGTDSLGHVLFNHPNLRRKQIEVASFSRESSVAQLAKHYRLQSKEQLWGRRSVFLIEDKPLMVAEVFLPQAFAYQHVTVHHD
ncbi:chorismate--pyruvate lyase family protein [Thalassotalea sediminis]|uniref:chorismate--pyruvate lyase family protein n=1 Tax=Thalassotalea sediminis TaxID=1759089 RepID=UPI0025723B37|nr:chorismate lyase [Thalassotalea sediminis]